MIPPERDLDPELERILRDAFGGRLDVEVASSHLWRIHHEAERRSALDGDRGEITLVGDVVAPAVAPQRDRPAPRGGGERPASSRPGVRVRGTRRLVVLVLTFGMMLSMSGAAVAASRGALPGDALYPVKRVSEQAALLLTPSAEGRAELRVRIAQARLEELLTASRERPDVVAGLWKDLEDTIEIVALEAPVEAESLRQQVVALAPTVASQITAAGSEPASSPLAEPTGDDAALALASTTPASRSATPAVTATDPAAVTPVPTTPSAEPAPVPTTTASASPAPSPTPTATPTSGAGDSDEPTTTDTTAAPQQPTGGGTEPAPSSTPTTEASEPNRPRPEPPDGAGREEPETGGPAGPSDSGAQPSGPAAEPSGGSSGDAPAPAETEEPAPESSGTLTYGRPG